MIGVRAQSSTMFSEAGPKFTFSGSPNYNLLFRWFVGLTPDDSIWHPTTYGLQPTASTPKTGIGS
jgi:uncharacterized protein YodC (DUF2158 family)